MGNIDVLQGSDVVLPDPAVMQDAVRRAFRELGEGHALQPPQDVLVLPGGGDVITYRAVVGDPGVLAVKLSPYLPQSGGPAVITAWAAKDETEPTRPSATG